MKLKKSLIAGCCLLLLCTVTGVHFSAAQMAVPSFQTILMPGTASHLAVAPNGELWAIGTEAVPGGHNILFWANNQWNRVEGGATKIVVAGNNEPWIVNSEGFIFRREGYRWIALTGLPVVKEIAVGREGMIYGIGMQDQVYQFLSNGTVVNSMPAQPNQYEREREERERREREQAQQQQPVVVGCRNAYAMAGSDFGSAISTINGQSFDDSKLTTAKQVAGANCLSTDQIGQIMALFSFEDRKLTFAKFAYDHCTDPQSYYKLNSQFTFSSNSDALSSFVQSKQ